MRIAGKSSELAARLGGPRDAGQRTAQVNAGACAVARTYADDSHLAVASAIFCRGHRYAGRRVDDGRVSPFPAAAPPTFT